ncbi:MAG: YgiQ family radical SAM protein [Deltaproteobacteria bacterium]|jgi:uncharacterized radical SAM protein YgiQ|nr:YgiQ family radical SAM protein [Deltaproteobacteria bacterium]MBT4526041.1 YgiQ family radical SAM protein [Deltaproteobacteria bacterium]
MSFNKANPITSPAAPESVKWLPTSKREMERLGWDQLDVILVTGDAYVDHPSFGIAVIARLIQNYGYRVGILAQPNWRDDLRDFKKLGKPRLFFGVSAGNMDSMVNHYTAAKRLRSDDAYTPGGENGYRPDYAVNVYTSTLKKIYPEAFIILGGIEASLRRFAHYDYWADSVLPPILVSSQADLLIYGMAESALKQILELIDRNIPIQQLVTVPQTAFLWSDQKKIAPVKKWKTIELNSFESCRKTHLKYAENFKWIECESNKKNAARLLQKVEQKVLIVNPPEGEMKTEQLDKIYELPFNYLPHPKYNKRHAIPAYEMIKHSVNVHRGCFGGCSFCTISTHQGKNIISRSKKSILHEIHKIAELKDFKGYLSDLGGPSANMYRMTGVDKKTCDKCSKPSCIFPKVCKNLNISHGPLLDLYRKVNTLPFIKKAFVTSGIRYDLFGPESLIKYPENSDYLFQVMQHHVSGRLKVAPEHTSDRVLKMMRKPSFNLFKKLKSDFDRFNEQLKTRQQLIPYFISSHPGCELIDMVDLSIETQKLGYQLKQVQDFTPTPLTLATTIYHTGINPYDHKTVFVAKMKNDKDQQRKIFFWYLKQNRAWFNQLKKKLKKKTKKKVQKYCSIDR